MIAQSEAKHESLGQKPAQAKRPGRGSFCPAPGKPEQRDADQRVERVDFYDGGLAPEPGGRGPRQCGHEASQGRGEVVPSLTATDHALSQVGQQGDGKGCANGGEPCAGAGRFAADERNGQPEQKLIGGIACGVRHPGSESGGKEVAPICAVVSPG